MEIQEQKIEGKPKIAWEAQEFFVNASVKQVETLSLALAGRKVGGDGEIKNIKHFSPQIEEQKMRVWVQNNVKTTQPTTGKDWQEFVDAVCQKIKEYKVLE